MTDFVETEIPGALFSGECFRGFLYMSGMFQTVLFNQVQNLIQPHGNDTQNQNGHQNRSQFKGLAGIDDEIAKPLPGADKFSDDHANQTKSDINLHGT